MKYYKKDNTEQQQNNESLSAEWNGGKDDEE